MKTLKILSYIVIGLGILMSSEMIYAHGGGGHGGGWHGGGWHGGGWHGGGWHGGGWGSGYGGWIGGFGPGLIINAPVGYIGQCQIIKQCYRDGTCVRREICS